MTTKRLLVIASSLLALVSFNAHAERMNFAFIQVTGLLNTDLENSFIDEDGDGLGIRGSWIYGPYAFSDIRYDDVDLTNDTESRSGSARLGIRNELDLRSPLRLDIYGMISLEAVELERGTTQLLSDEGVGIAGGLRFGPIEQLEGNLEYNFADYGNGKGQFLVLEGIWNIADWFAMTLEYRNGDYNIDNGPDIDRSDLNLGLRVLFGGDER